MGRRRSRARCVLLMSLLIYRERHPQTVEVERVVEVEVLPKAKLRWDEPAEGSAETGQPL